MFNKDKCIVLLNEDILFRSEEDAIALFELRTDYLFNFEDDDVKDVKEIRRNKHTDQTY